MIGNASANDHCVNLLLPKAAELHELELRDPYQKVMSIYSVAVTMGYAQCSRPSRRTRRRYRPGCWQPSMPYTGDAIRYHLGAHPLPVNQVYGRDRPASTLGLHPRTRRRRLPCSQRG